MAQTSLGQIPAAIGEVSAAKANAADVELEKSMSVITCEELREIVGRQIRSSILHNWLVSHRLCARSLPGAGRESSIVCNQR